MAEIEGLEPGLAVKYFKSIVHPKAVCEYQVDTSQDYEETTDSDEPLIVTLLMKCLHTHKIPIPRVRLIIY